MYYKEKNLVSQDLNYVGKLTDYTSHISFNTVHNFRNRGDVKEERHYTCT